MCLNLQYHRGNKKCSGKQYRFYDCKLGMCELSDITVRKANVLVGCVTRYLAHRAKRMIDYYCVFLYILIIFPT